MALPAELERSIREVAPRAQIEIHFVNGRWSGLVVATEFEELTHLDRQKQVWSRIRENMREGAKDVGMLSLYTPEEADAVEEAEED